MKKLSVACMRIESKLLWSAFPLVRVLLLLCSALWLAGGVGLSAQDPDRPLPDPLTFLAEFRRTLRSDRTLLSQYTYTEKRTETTLDSKGNPKKTESKIYQVMHGAEEWQTYERLIEKNGQPLSQKELDKEDREQSERVARESHKRDSQSESKRGEAKAKEDKKEQETLDDIFAMYEVQALGREMLDGRPAIRISFKSRTNYKPRTDDGKILQHIAGKVWVSEKDYQLAKLEAEVIDPISLGAGFLAKLQKGSTVAFERRKINDEIWLPVRAEALLNGRLLLLKGINLRAVNEYSEHKKYAVDTILKFGPPPQ